MCRLNIHTINMIKTNHIVRLRVTKNRHRPLATRRPAPIPIHCVLVYNDIIGRLYYVRFRDINLRKSN